jgi:tRNA threonylcarbamoyladenosine biosynthesis protein TsaE
MMKASASEQETRELGRALASRLRLGDHLFLSGELGAGKTTFLQGVVEGLGGRIPATSPSFVIAQEYPLLRGVFRHIDLYRLPDPALDRDRIGLPELLSDPEAITAVEWSDRLPAALGVPGRTIHIRFRHGADATQRLVDITEPE